MVSLLVDLKKKHDREFQYDGVSYSLWNKYIVANITPNEYFQS